MTHLHNEQVRVSISREGAELQSIRHQQSDIEYLWQGNPKFWAKRAPVLFPIVGALKNDSYYYNSVAHHMSRHGFARDLAFKLIHHDDTEAVFELLNNDLTLKQYPFQFSLKIRYLLRNDILITIYEVSNRSDREMLFSIGGHPAFNVPLVSGTAYEDHYLELDQTETAARWPLENNLIGETPIPFLNNEQKIWLNHALFERDAIVLKGLKSSSIKLKCTHHRHGLELKFGGFPYLGIWAARDAPFVCIEPWAGIADSVGHNQQLDEKEGIIALEAGGWVRSWELRFW